MITDISSHMLDPETVSILLVDRKKEDLQWLRSMLSGTEGPPFHVERVPDMADAFDRLQKSGSNVILLDDASIEDTDEFIQLQEKHRDIPVIVMNGTADTSVGREMVRHGAQDYLVKTRVDAYLLVCSIHHAIERKKTENALGDSIGEWHATFDVIHDLVTLIDLEHRVVKCNRKMADFLKKEFKEIIGNDLFALIRDIEHHSESEELRGLVRDPPSEPVVMNIDGRRFKVIVTVLDSKSGEKLGTVLTLHDITQTERLTRNLRHSENRLRILYDYAPDAYFLIHEDGTITDCNKSAENLLGYSKNEIVGDNLYSQDIITSDYIRKATSCFHKRCSEEPFGLQEISLCHKDRTRIPVEINAFPVDMDSEKLVLVLARDITERKQAEHALAESESRYRALIEDTPAMICRFYPDGTLSFVNDAYCTYFDTPRDQLVGYNFFNFIPEDARDDVKEKYSALTTDNPCVTYEHKVKAPDGTIKWQMWTDRALFDAEGRVTEFQSVGQDITRVKMAEQELQKNQKLESLGVLAGGIAHDFNNILTGVVGNLSIAKLKKEDPAELEDILENAEKAAMRARDLTMQLLTFSRGGAPVREVACIADLIRECVKFASSGSNVRCSCDLPDNLRKVNMDEGQISQVLNNLVINAEQAMPDGGELTVKARNTVITENTDLPLEPGTYVAVSVRDRGAGIPDNILPNIFDPYFTTKESGNGLGLASVYSIIRKHDGHITVKSKPGQGSVFVFYLPASEESPCRKNTITTDIWTGTGTICIMDDEETVRDIAGRMLEELGYNVQTVCDGKELLEILEDSDLPPHKVFDVILMDLTIPGGMGGRETMKQLMQMDPDIKVIVSSGYSTSPLMANFREYGFKGRISKPYEIEEMSTVIKRVLEK